VVPDLPSLELRHGKPGDYRSQTCRLVANPRFITGPISFVIFYDLATNDFAFPLRSPRPLRLPPFRIILLP
jgi:hypothetical protein